MKLGSIRRRFVVTVLLATSLFGAMLFMPRILVTQDPFVRSLGSVRATSNQSMMSEVKDRQFPDTLLNTTNAVYAPFNDSMPKYVVILTYQRCGSSFFGNIFNLNPNAFYAYEPLDSLYTALYGTDPGWNVPSDITNNANGSPRAIPRVEIEAVSEFLLHLLTGQVEQLPTEALVSKFWTNFPEQHKGLIKFRNCLTNHNLTRVRCYQRIWSFCGSRFAARQPDRLEKCRKLLANDMNATTAGIIPTVERSFHEYISCFQSYRRQVDHHCTSVLQQTITGHQLRATKVVRATMDSMRPLLSALPNLRIIHLVRDPRAVALSRSRFGSSGQGSYTIHMTKSSRIVAEARLYCHHVISDIRSRLALEREFPGRILLMRYEDVMANPGQRFQDIYKLLDEPIPSETLKEMQKRASSGQSSNLTTKWRGKITYEEGIRIARQCAEYFDLLNISAYDI